MRLSKLGIGANPPQKLLHKGDFTVDRLPFTQMLSSEDRDALVAYVKTL